MKWVRRYLNVQAFMLWQGGFLFYAAFVVPIGTEVLGSSAEQGGITRHVTDRLNACGTGALALCLWDLLAAPGRKPARWLLWLGMAVTLVGLATLHPVMETYLDEPPPASERTWSFRFLHRTYLWVSTVQWLFGVAYVFLMLRGWGEEDRSVRQPNASRSDAD